MANKEQNKYASRRKLLKSVVAGGGVLATGKLLPESWMKPVVQAVVLPAHAQTSAGPLDGLYATGLLSPQRIEFIDQEASAAHSILDMFVSPAQAVVLEPGACNVVTRIQISIAGGSAKVCLSGPDAAYEDDTDVDQGTGALGHLNDVGGSGIALRNMTVFGDPAAVVGETNCGKGVFKAPLVPGTYDCSPLSFNNTSNVFLSSPFEDKA